MNSEITKIRQADRKPVDNIQAELSQLNAIATEMSDAKIKFHWTLSQDAVGPCLKAYIEFKVPLDCLKFINSLYELQESADHHAHVIMNNFHSVTLMLSTHEPVPAITKVDVLFARFVQNKISVTT